MNWGAKQQENTLEKMFTKKSDLQGPSKDPLKILAYFDIVVLINAGIYCSWLSALHLKSVSIGWVELTMQVS